MTIDLTGVATSCIAGVFAVLGIILPILINNHMKDRQAAAVLAMAVKNSLGAIQQSVDGVIMRADPTVTLPDMPGVSPQLKVGVQYVLNHAGDEADRFGITPVAIAGKISAQMGLVKLADQQAIAVAMVAAPPPISA